MISMRYDSETQDVFSLGFRAVKMIIYKVEIDMHEEQPVTLEPHQDWFCFLLQ